MIYLTAKQLEKLEYIRQTSRIHKTLLGALDDSINLTDKLHLLLESGWEITVKDNKGNVFLVSKFFK